MQIQQYNAQIEELVRLGDIISSRILDITTKIQLLLVLLPQCEHVVSYEDLELSNLWKCADSPTGFCIYDNLEDPAWDNCLFCNDPYERS